MSIRIGVERKGHANFAVCGSNVQDSCTKHAICEQVGHGAMGGREIGASLFEIQGVIGSRKITIAANARKHESANGRTRNGVK